MGCAGLFTLAKALGFWVLGLACTPSPMESWFLGLCGLRFGVFGLLGLIGSFGVGVCGLDLRAFKTP